MKNRLSQAQQKVIDLLKSDPELFVIESIYYDWNKVTNNEPDHKWTAFKRPTFDVLVKLGFLVKDQESVVKYKKWVLNRSRL